MGRVEPRRYISYAQRNSRSDNVGFEPETSRSRLGHWTNAVRFQIYKSLVSNVFFEGNIHLDKDCQFIFQQWGRNQFAAWITNILYEVYVVTGQIILKRNNKYCMYVTKCNHAKQYISIRLLLQTYPFVMG